MGGDAAGYEYSSEVMVYIFAMPVADYTHDLK